MSAMRGWRWLAVLGPVVLTACSDGGGGGKNSAPVEEKNPAVSNPTYYEHVAQILNDNCVSCHQAGGIAPFPLDDYGSASMRAAVIGSVTRARSMPPFLVDNSGACNTFQDARWLSDNDITTLSNWAEQGAPAGDTPAQPPQAAQMPGLAPAEISATASMAEAYVPQGQPPDNPGDDYRCFIIDPGITDQDKYLTAFEAVPGNSALVHHMILFALNTAAAEQAAQQLDAADAGPGYTCFGDSGLDNSFAGEVTMVAGWAPGVKVTRYPSGTGVLLVKDRKLVLQVHYNLDNGDGSDQSAMRLALSAAVQKQALILPLADTKMVLPAGQTDTKFTARYTLPVQLLSAQIHGVFPHMHTLGRSLTVENTTSGGAKQCLAQVPRWDFNWQQFFFYDESKPAVRVHAGDTLSVTCSYDTRSRSEPVAWGNGTRDEMCVNFFYVTP